MNNRLRMALLCAGALVYSPFLAFAGCHKSCSEANAFSVVVNGKTAVTFVPNGAWEIATTGVRVVPLEGTSAKPVTIATPGVVDACASDRLTDQVVCTATDTDVYLISGTTLTKTLHSSGSGTIGFSGGSCTNCSLAINPISGIAYIEEAVASSPAVQSLNLKSRTFGKPLLLANGISESIQVDTVRNILLSASERSIYDVITLGGDGAPVAEYGNASVSAEYDASGEDCEDGTIIGTDETTGNLFVANADLIELNKVSKTWSDSEQALVYFPEFSNLSAGTTGFAITPGTHYAVVAGEFGGNLVGFLKLPAVASVAAKDLQNYVVATLPADPAGLAFANGYDPHAVTAYESPNDGKAYAVMADWAGGQPNYVAIIDIAAMLAAPRVTSSSGAKHEVDPSYDLVAHHVVRYVRTY